MVNPQCFVVVTFIRPTKSDTQGDTQGNTQGDTQGDTKGGTQSGTQEENLDKWIEIRENPQITI